MDGNVPRKAPACVHKISSLLSTIRRINGMDKIMKKIENLSEQILCLTSLACQ